MTDIFPVFTRMQDQKIRLTKIRKLLVEILIRSDGPVTVSQLLSLVHPKSPKVNKTTIYRQLEFLIQNSLAKSVDFGDGTIRYEWDSKDHHHHLICQKCHRIESVNLTGDLTILERKITEQKQFQILRHSLEFFGYCSRCYPVNTVKS